MTPLTPWGPPPEATVATTMGERILDAARRRFMRDGVAATTMSQIATDAGISRMWLYRHYPSRDAVMAAVLAREVRTFLAGLAGLDDGNREPVDVLVDVFVYSVAFLRGHELAQRLLQTDPDAVVGFLTSHADQVMTVAVDMGVSWLTRRAGVRPAHGRAVAETLVRLGASIALTPKAAVDFDRPRQVRRFANQVIPRLLVGEPD